MVARKLRRAAIEMLEQLDAHGLEVCKAPSNQGGYVRVCISRNADWYREFCGNWIMPRRKRRWRKPRTIIKRRDTRLALLEIAQGRCDTVYAERLMPYCEAMAREMRAGERRLRRETA